LIFRPFSTGAKISCRARSILLQRAMVDFGADESFSGAVEKVKEHYGIDIASSTTRLDVEKHAQAMHEMIDKKELCTISRNDAAVIIGEIDGCMVPIVTKKTNDCMESDQRKNKNHEWKESRLALARAKGSVDPVYGATMGSVEEAGAKLADVVKSAGEGQNTKIHCIGDGAPWIADQVELLFGIKAKFLLDFFHLSEYLACAASCCKPNEPKNWLREQQKLLKNNMAQDVLQNIQDHLDQCALKKDCPALKCFNYMSKRLDQLDYKRAIELDLPIGSGEIESGHRSVVQARLKITGAWWTIDNAKNILALRITRANGFWNKYWTGIHKPSGIQAYG
jgi:hypothetical protein